MCAGTRVDAYDPKPAKIALAILAVPGGIPHAFEHGFVGALNAAARAEIACCTSVLFVSQMGYWSTFTRAMNTPLRSPGRQRPVASTQQPH